MALAGDHIIVIMDDSSGAPRQFADGDITSVDLGLTYDQHDVAGFGDAAHSFINGQLQAPVIVKGFLTTTANIGTHTVINGAFQAGDTHSTVAQQVHHLAHCAGLAGKHRPHRSAGKASPKARRPGLSIGRLGF